MGMGFWLAGYESRFAARATRPLLNQTSVKPSVNRSSVCYGLRMPGLSGHDTLQRSAAATLIFMLQLRAPNWLDLRLTV
jgi:hypothetical protein